MLTVRQTKLHNSSIDGNLSIIENQTFVFEFNATDTDGDVFHLLIVSGSDSQLFDLNATSGVLRFITAKTLIVRKITIRTIYMNFPFWSRMEKQMPP